MKLSISGNKGDKVRSDCYMEVKTLNGNKTTINLHSKVKALYGESIRKQIKTQLAFYNLPAELEINMEDTGALPFTIAARLEAAVNRLFPLKQYYIPEIIAANNNVSHKEQFRFSRLYLPGNTPAMMINAGIHKPNGIILDLEDAVVPEKKDEARFLVRNALCQVNFYGAERMVRINQGKRGLNDLEFVAPYHVNMILIPKVETPKQMEAIDKKITSLRKAYKFTYPIFYMPILESALGIENAFAIAKSSPNIAAMAIGLEDYTADIGVQRTKIGSESLYARMRMVNACKAVGIQPIDSVFSDVSDMEGLLENIINSKTLGFEGMGCIHPRQIPVINEGFKPDEQQIEKAKQIMMAFMQAKKEGKGVIKLGTKMIDPPVVKRAETTVNLAISLGILSKDWMN